MRLELHKLVRHRILQRMKEKGEHPQSKRLTKKEFTKELYHKLLEEAIELFSARGEASLSEEIADVLEVIRVMVSANKLDMVKIKRIQRIKRRKNGTFTQEAYLISVDDK